MDDMPHTDALAPEDEFRFRITDAQTWRTAVICMQPTLIRLRQHYTASGQARQQLRKARLVWDFGELQPGTLRMSVFLLILSQMHQMHRYLGILPEIILPQSLKLRELIYFSGFRTVAKTSGLVVHADEQDYGGISVRPSMQRFRLAYLPRPPDLPDVNLVGIDERRILKKTVLHMAWNMFDQHLRFAFRAKENPTTGLPDNGALRSNVASAISELVANAWLWGKSDCLIGLQSTYDSRTRLWKSSLAVSDSGMGFCPALRHSADYAHHFRTVPEAADERCEVLWFLASLFTNQDLEGLRRILEVTREYRGRFYCAYGAEVMRIDFDTAEALLRPKRETMLAAIVVALRQGYAIPSIFPLNTVKIDPLGIRMPGVHAELEIIHQAEWI